MNVTYLLFPVHAEQGHRSRKVCRINLRSYRRRTGIHAEVSPGVRRLLTVELGKMYSVCKGRIADRGWVIRAVQRIEQAIATTNHHRLLFIDCVGKPGARSEVILVHWHDSIAGAAGYDHARHVGEVITCSPRSLGWRSKQIVTEAEVQGQAIIYLPIVLNEEAIFLSAQVERPAKNFAAVNRRLISSFACALAVPP